MRSAALAEFLGQLDGTLAMLRYFLLMQSTFPYVMLQLTPEQRRDLAPITRQWIEFCREIYAMPELGTAAPDPLRVEPNCPPHLLSDHTRERIGRNHPFFDFVNAPFTHPIGTEISITCISSVWNAYDTFVNARLADLKKSFPDDMRIQALVRKEKQIQAKEIEPLSTDEKLSLLGINQTDADLEKAAADLGSNLDVPISKADLLLRAGKDIRTAFTHRFGKPTKRLLQMMAEEPFELLGFRETTQGFEVTLLGSRNIIEVVQLKALTIDYKAQSWPAIGTAKTGD